ncbi:thrombospondin type 3 repeat-containing protein [Pseudoalteromonas sp. BDTF-M6]|uniref:thrombospondin type 3 repeat-containing protein n=1 Tax=Pseudoalteromonas sp. BDTF-M6 TaxID=2796132 RepID=UPI001BB0A08A|nr:thrombospondin type 3 repeat-containing protein [Pseudoalteromonas sp. BDTF-M6]MBS3796360.1 thrombospondin type 3 repeat-containing protein [Pseudoalteromonas sp. BDTF-M6]
MQLSTSYYSLPKQLLIAILILLFIPSTFALTALEGQKILAQDGAYFDYFGSSISIDGNLAVIGANQNCAAGEDGGKAYIYHRNNDGIWQYEATLIPNTLESAICFGQSVAISGHTVVVGAPLETTLRYQDGAAYVFIRDEQGDWMLQDKLLGFASGRAQQLGSSVAIQGNTIVVGAPQYLLGNGSGAITGAAYVYKRIADSWELPTILTPAPEEPQLSFGYGERSIVIDNGTILVGTWKLNEPGKTTVGPGGVYVFVLNALNNWELQQVIVPQDLTDSSSLGFGHSVGLDGDVAVIGAPLDKTIRQTAGSSYIYRRNGGIWQHEVKLLSENFDETSNFGRAVATESGVVLIGGNTFGSVPRGTADLYLQDDTNQWLRIQQLQPSETQNFGTALAISGNSIMGADIYDDTQAGNSGAVYVFDLKESTNDDDGDGIANGVDNCPSVNNPDQIDSDFDGIGNACDVDNDNDGLNNELDNCPLVTNFDQLDNDLDTIGDECDPDDDNDGIIDISDNCQFDSNPDQLDRDNDGQGDQCDNDGDGDGIDDLVDNCPTIINPSQSNNDDDLMGDLCDPDDDNDNVLDLNDNCPITPNPNQDDLDNDGIGDICDMDLDGDGVNNSSDNCPGIPNQSQSDSDFDGSGNACDLDDDDDGIYDDNDNCPNEANQDQSDNDSDAIGDACDPDDDNDGIVDSNDNCPLVENSNQQNNDGDAMGNACDSDDDNDNINDELDNCPLISNANQSDLDNNGVGDLCDEDLDGDGVANLTDNCPEVPNSEQLDLDSDGVGDACDSDKDDDGHLNAQDNCPNIANPEQFDLDNDGVGDLCDLDDDNDGIEDEADNCPAVYNPNQIDFDNNGLGDACDTDDDNDSVTDYVDLCPLTPQFEVVDPTNGCSITQLVPCSGPRGSTEHWRNHGQYISLISAVTNEFVLRGLIDKSRRKFLISNAAQSSCGKH